MFKSSLILAILFIAQVASPFSIWYAATNGSDLNVGNDPNQPFRTIQKAHDSASAGDIIYCLQGIGEGPALFNERPLLSKNGTPGAPIVFVATNWWKASNITVRAFDVTGDNIWIVGFQVTQTAVEFANSPAWPGIRFNAATNGFVSDCYIHHTDIGGDGTIQIENLSDRFTFRGNKVWYAGTTNSGANMSPHGASTWHAYANPSPGNNYQLLEFNDMRFVGDFFVPWVTNCIIQGNVLGPNDESYANGGPHIDVLQCDGPSRYVLVRNTWHVDNNVSNSHYILMEAPVSGRSAYITGIRTCSIRSGDQLWFQMRDSTNQLSAHNTVGQAGFRHGTPASSGFYRLFSDTGGAPNNCESYNCIFTNCSTVGGQIYLVETGSLISNNSFASPASADFISGVAGNLEGDPLFVNYTNNNLRLQSGSTAIDAGRALTTTTNSGTGTTFGVNNIYWFTDGMGMTKGDHIYVGNDTDLAITSIDRTTSRITVSQSFTWANGDGVGYIYRGNGPDMGCYEFGDTVLSQATITHNGSTHTVTVDGDTYMVVFYTNGIPQTPVYSTNQDQRVFFGSYGPSWVTANAYAERPQSNMVFRAAEGGENPPEQLGPNTRTKYKGLRLKPTL